ncbi:MAG: tRNA (adenosine(37)-N6)-threonylcarbamoyltransferase complex transferase subunit TsaD [Parcubacteria group bacterium]
MSLIFSVETSCDETAMALVEAKGKLANPRFKIIKSAVLSQIAIHKQFGGVVPNIAKREHGRALPLMIKRFTPIPEFKNSDFIAVTAGPGLEPALWTGIEFARALGKETGRHVFAANHIKGHLYSFLLSNPKKYKKLFPMIALVVSGGHTILFKLDNLGAVKKIGETRDDAAGEALDKGARLLGLPYPGGPELERLALKGNANAFDFPRPMVGQKNYDFSFAGLKTSLLYKLKGSNKANWKEINKDSIIGKNKNLASGFQADIAASYEKAIIDCLVIKSFRAVDNHTCRSIAISGGVSANKLLRSEFAREAKKRKIPFLAPGKSLSTDNAAMIAVSSYIEDLKGVKRKLAADGNLAT